MGPHQRGRYLFEVADLIETHGDELAELITLDNGKPIAESVEIDRAASSFRYYGGWATKFYGETNPSDPGFFNYTLREPVGVCGQIVPWNGPLVTLSWKIAPALAFGNTLVLKACRTNSTSRDPTGRIDLRDGLARWRGQYCYRVWANCGRRDRLASGNRQGRLHRIDRGRQTDPSGVGRQSKTRVFGIGRQVAERHIPGRPDGAGGRTLGYRRFPKSRPGLLCSYANVRTGAHLRRLLIVSPRRPRKSNLVRRLIGRPRWDR
jgi:Aldehyde dehydrogenase family